MDCCAYEAETSAVVAEFICEEKEFTAHDITRELRNKLQGTRVEHEEVRKVVHGLWETGGMIGYDRKLGTGYPSSVPPFVYYPANCKVGQDLNNQQVTPQSDNVFTGFFNKIKSLFS